MHLEIIKNTIINQLNMDVILVDVNDTEIGVEEKITVHKKGKLHRAFSIFIFNSNKELLLQKRSMKKYHSAGLWSNTCCSHPQPNSNLKKEAEQRLKQEMGINCKLKKSFSFTYKIKFENGLIENEFDHVFIGEFNGEPKPNKDEVCDWKWISLYELKKDIKKNPQNYTYWLKICLDKIIEKVK